MNDLVEERARHGVALAISFTLGQVHATPWDRHPNEAVVEWPLSPWRVLRALYAVHVERCPELPANEIGGLLSQLGASPPTYRLPPAGHAHTRHWYPSSAHRSDPKGYEKARALDAFMAVDRQAPLYMIFDSELSDRQLDLLHHLTSRLTYLGRAESRVDVSAQAGPLPERAGYTVCAPAAEDAGLAEEAVRLLVATTPLDLAALATGTAAVQKRRLNLPPGSHQVAYTVPTSSPAPAPPRPRPRPSITAVLWHLTAPALPSVRAALLQGEALHQQILWDFKRLTDGAHSPALSGRDADRRPRRDDHRHAHALHYDLDGDGLLDTAVLWTPGGLADDDIRAISQTREIRDRAWLRDFRAVTLGLEYLGGHELLPPAIMGPSRRWTSLTPFAPPHHPKRHQRPAPTWVTFVEAQVRKACQWHGLPPPSSVAVRSAEPWLTHRRHRGGEQLRDARRAVGLTLTFDQDICGPVALGAFSHYGLGVFVPDTATSARAAGFR